MGILGNWGKIDKEFDLWEKTINKNFRISIGLVIIGAVSSIFSIVYTNLGGFSVLFVLGFGGLALFYSFVIGDRKIKGHQNRINELSK